MMSSRPLSEPAGASETPCTILIVDSNPADVKLAEEAFREAGLSPELHVATTGEEALAFLRREGRFANAPKPDFIMLERTLPMMTGMEVLEAMKSEPDFVSIPVVVCSTTQHKDELTEAYILRAEATVNKSSDLDAYFAVIKTFHAAWCKDALNGSREQSVERG
jgi:two-component system, chemotaxis family, response regulator Rcp1